ncbi:hypothetical protein N9R04_09645 [Staphylococcus sp. SQ8-PEA]|uniref:Uncharacterized protein n=1 Tax=Staphylococcus marylandisciuri TaxID=2981529 RepID=A0ABT2QSH2_9STAP|nr:hypothetical protein [Staphylococcus marylandisciuri]MCU5746940.1 hypothetical protein [Staphylococcus marylandisciuri]
MAITLSVNPALKRLYDTQELQKEVYREVEQQLKDKDYEKVESQTRAALLYVKTRLYNYYKRHEIWGQRNNETNEIYQLSPYQLYEAMEDEDENIELEALDLIEQRSEMYFNVGIGWLSIINKLFPYLGLRFDLEPFDAQLFKRFEEEAKRVMTYLFQKEPWLFDKVKSKHFRQNYLDHIIKEAFIGAHQFYRFQSICGQMAETFIESKRHSRTEPAS